MLHEELLTNQSTEIRPKPVGGMNATALRRRKTCEAGLATFIRIHKLAQGRQNVRQDPVTYFCNTFMIYGKLTERMLQASLATDCSALHQELS